MSTAPLNLPQVPIQGPHAGPSPEKLFEIMTAYQHTAALKAAIELDLFTAIGEGQNTVPGLTKRINGSERAVRILCDCLVVIGFLLKNEDRYGLTADSTVFLDKRSHTYFGSAKNFVASPLMMEAFKDLAKQRLDLLPQLSQPVTIGLAAAGAQVNIGYEESTEQTRAALDRHDV